MPLGSHASSDLSAEDRARLLRSQPGEPTAASSAPEAAEAEPIGPAPQTQPANSAAAPAPIWLQRTSLIILVLFCVYLGILVAVLPWWTHIWDDNLFINSHPALATVLHNGAVRGLISGLGLLDIWIGISEAIHYRDHRP